MTACRRVAAINAGLHLEEEEEEGEYIIPATSRLIRRKTTVSDGRCIYLVASRKFACRTNTSHRQVSSSGCKAASHTQTHLQTTPAHCSNSEACTDTAVTAATYLGAEQITSRKVWGVQQIPGQYGGYDGPKKGCKQVCRLGCLDLLLLEALLQGWRMKAQ